MTENDLKQLRDYGAQFAGADDDSLTDERVHITAFWDGDVDEIPVEDTALEVVQAAIIKRLEAERDAIAAIVGEFGGDTLIEQLTSLRTLFGLAEMWTGFSIPPESDEEKTAIENIRKNPLAAFNLIREQADRLKDERAERDALVARIAILEAALRPFAQATESAVTQTNQGYSRHLYVLDTFNNPHVIDYPNDGMLSINHLRNAADALKGKAK